MSPAEQAHTPAIFGLSVFGDPFDRRSWSGSSWSLFHALQQRGALVDARSVDLSTAQKCISAARSFTLDRRRLYLDIMKSRASFDMRSRNAERVLEGNHTYNCVLQISALFLPAKRNHALRCSYHDGNTAISRRPEFSFMSAASPRVMRESLEYEREFYSQMDIVFTMSEFLRRSMIHDFGAAEEKVVTAGVGINLDNTVSPPAGSKDYRKRKILFVGTNWEFKGGPALLEAFRTVRREVPDATLTIVGCTPALNEPGVEVVGVLDKQDAQQEQRLKDLYREATLFVLPTLYDAFGIAFVEAMFYRVPCIGSNRCAIPEIIQHGKTGFLVDPTAPREIAARMIELLQDERLSQQFGDQAQERASADYRWDLVVDTMLKEVSCRL